MNCASYDQSDMKTANQNPDRLQIGEVEVEKAG